MAAVTQTTGSLAALTATGLSTLASATYVASNVYSNVTNKPLDLMVELTVATTNSPSGNKQAVLFCSASFDNTNFQSGPTSGTTTTDEGGLTFIGSLGVNVTATTYRRSFSVAAAYGGVLPPYLKFVIKNDLGVALTTGTIATSEIALAVN